MIKNLSGRLSHTFSLFTMAKKIAYLNYSYTIETSYINWTYLRISQMSCTTSDSFQPNYIKPKAGQILMINKSIAHWRVPSFSRALFTSKHSQNDTCNFQNAANNKKSNAYSAHILHHWAIIACWTRGSDHSAFNPTQGCLTKDRTNLRF
jgi:hypothetical protein